jgi:hypothetical protein
MWEYGEEMKGRLKARIAKIREAVAAGVVAGEVVFEKGVGHNSEGWRVESHPHSEIKVGAILEELRLMQDELKAIDRAERDAFDRADRAKALLQRLCAEEADRERGKVN